MAEGLLSYTASSAMAYREAARFRPGGRQRPTVAACVMRKRDKATFYEVPLGRHRENSEVLFEGLVAVATNTPTPAGSTSL